MAEKGVGKIARAVEHGAETAGKAVGHAVKAAFVLRPELEDRPGPPLGPHAKQAADPASFSAHPGHGSAKDTIAGYKPGDYGYGPSE